ncbi:MAG: hypothetical protein R3297_11055, partial [Desulfobulbales bacterium]|nr:hypothetical protein [Desulfobulbales bacterium]
MWEMEHYERSVDLFKKVYGQNPTDQTALAGLVEGLNKLDRKKEALPYLNELVRLQPTNRGLRRYLAFLLYDSENYDKARAHFTILARNEDVELDVLRKTARTYERLALDRQASEYWERVLARDPENIAAHTFLAGYYENIKQQERALAHLEAILAYAPDEVSYAHLGKTYEMAGNHDKALTYYGKYLVQYPDDHETLQRIEAINNARAEKRQTREALSPSRAVNVQALRKKLQMKIDDLAAGHRYREAIPVYRQLFEISPADSGTLETLGRNLTAISKNEGINAMVTFLADVALNNKAVYRSLAKLLRSKGQQDELLAVLNEIHGFDPGDNLTTQELALLCLERGELEAAEVFFAKLSDSQCRNVRCLEGRALLAEKLYLPAHRLRDYQALLKLQPDRNEIRLAVIGLAAEMGLLDAAVFHAGYLQYFTSADKDLEPKILLADAYRESGYLARAIERYRSALNLTSEQTESLHGLRIRSWLGIAESYEKLGLLYEAEQTLRAALVHEKNRIPVLEALFYLFLRADRIDDSEIWLTALNQEIQEFQERGPASENPAWKKEFLQAQMYGAANDHDLAIELYNKALALLPQKESSKTRVQGMQKAVSENVIQTHMARSFFKKGEYAAAEKIILGLQNNEALALELQVLLEQVYRSWGRTALADSLAARTEEYAAEDFGRQLALAGLYRTYNDPFRQ